MASQGKQTALLGAYLVVGEDLLKQRRVIDRLRGSVARAGDLSFNHDEFDGADATGAVIVDSCNTLPFASEKRLVEVVNADKLRKADSEAIVAYLASPNESTVLCLVAEKLAKNTRLYKAVAAVGRNAVIDCAPLKRYELVSAVRSMAVSHGFTLTQGAAQRLIELVGEDTVRIDSELRKLALEHRGPDAMGEREVSAMVAQTAEAKPWEFVDAFSARDAKTCLRLLPLLKATSSFALLAFCVSRIRELLCARALAVRDESANLPAALKLPSWRVKNHTAWARSFAPGALERALITSRDAERAMKSGTDPESAFVDWMLAALS